MKNKRVFAVLAGLVLMFGLILTGCPTDTKEEDKTTKFEGTWKHSFGNHVGYTFTGKSFNIMDDNGPQAMEGTFSFTDTTITFTLTSGSSGDRTTTYQFKKNDNGKDVLHLDRITTGAGMNYGDFEKQ